MLFHFEKPKANKYLKLYLYAWYNLMIMTKSVLTLSNWRSSGMSDEDKLTS